MLVFSSVSTSVEKDPKQRNKQSPLGKCILRKNMIFQHLMHTFQCAYKPLKITVIILYLEKLTRKS